MCNKDYIRQLLTEEKKLILLKDVKFANVPIFDELSVSTLWPHCTGIQELMVYFPDRLPKNRMPARDYFFSILMTKNESYLMSLIEHA